METENRQGNTQYDMIIMLGSPWGLPVFCYYREVSREVQVPLYIIRQDIAKMECDAIVNPFKIDTTPLNAHHYKLKDIEEAYHLFENKQDGVVKVAVEP